MDRNRYADLLRVVAMSGVVYGHWLLISITYAHGRLSGLDALGYVGWARWLTWLFQVVPIFFLVGGYVNARSWMAHHASGEDWVRWVRGRAVRLLWPTAVFAAVAALAVSSARLAGVSPGEISQAGWLVALHLWFLPVYLLLITLTPVLLPAHRRWGLAVPVAMAAAAALVDAGVRGLHVPVISYANYLFVWGSVHQWGFAWHDGTLTRARWRPYALTAAGTGLLACVLGWRVFNVDMIGAGNTNPPSVALLGYAAAQAGLLLAAEPVMSRLLLRPGLWQRVSCLNATAMTVYLWHFVPAIVIAVACYPTGIMPQPAIGTAPWWGLRPAWFALLTAALVPLVMAFKPAERPPAWLSCGRRPSGPWSPTLLLAGLAAAMTGLTRLAIAGFAPGGHLPVLVLVILAAGLTAIVLAASGSDWGPAPSGRVARPRPDRLPRKTTSRHADHRWRAPPAHSRMDVAVRVSRCRGT